MIILNRLVIGGTAINSLDVIMSLKSEFDIILVTGSKDQDESELELDAKYLGGYELIRIPGLQRPINPFRDLQAFFKIYSLIKSRQPSIIHTIGAKPGFLGRLAARLCRVPVIIHAYHGYVFNSYFNRLISGLLVRIERLSAKWTTTIISVSRKQVHELAAKYRIAPENKMIHLPIGIRHEIFQDPLGAKRRSFREQYFIREDEIAIGIVGRIVPVKDHMFFLDIVEKTLGKKASISYFVIGDGENLRHKLEHVATEKGIDHTYFPIHPRKAFITFTSWLHNIDTAMAGLDIVLLTSKNEGTPLSVIEAGLMGKPVVATNVGAVDEVMQPGVSGFIAEHGHVEDFAGKLLRLIEDPALREEMGSAGLAFTSARYRLQTQINATRDLYKKLLASKC